MIRWISLASCLVGCTDHLEPPPGRYFHHAGSAPCDTFVVDEAGAVRGFCESGGAIESGLFEPPQLSCANGPRYGFTPTLDGFALTQDGQVHVFVFSDRGTCERALPKPVEPTL